MARDAILCAGLCFHVCETEKVTYLVIIQLKLKPLPFAPMAVVQLALKILPSKYTVLGSYYKTDSADLVQRSRGVR